MNFKSLKKSLLLFVLSSSVITGLAQSKTTSIYHDKWIDFNKNGKKDVFEDPQQTVEARVSDLLSQMNVDEKTCQMATLYGYHRVLKDQLPTPEWKNEIWKDGIANIDEHLNSLPFNPEAKSEYSFPFSKHADAINQVQKWFIEQTRLGIPVDFTNEGIHGLNHDRATPLPSPINIGSTWDKSMVRTAGDIVGREAKALGYTNVYAPILDVSRDPRWGRVVETYGEDPFLIAELGKQMTLGIQENGVASTIKHFAVYSMPKGGRDGSVRTDPHITPRELHELYLYPFRRVIQEAKPLGVMSSYNDWNGMPVTGSAYFLTELLRKQYGFTGYVVSDSEAVEYLFTKHHVAKDVEDAVRLAIEAGLNVRTNFSPPETYILPLRNLIKSGKVSMETLNSRVADVLRVKFKLGLFDQPYVNDPKLSDKKVHTQADDDFALQLNKESMVLLKNEPYKNEQQPILPLDKNKVKSILITGPLATETNYELSRYGPSNNPVTSVLDGIKNEVGSKVKITYAKGCNVVDATWPESEIIPTPLTNEEQKEIDNAVAEAKLVDVVIAVVGEDEKRVGEGLSRSGLDLPGRQRQLLQALYATGKPIIMVMVNGQPLTINWENRYLTAILEAWFPGAQGGKAIAQTLFGEYNPGGKLPMTFPKSVGQIELNFPFKKGSQLDQPGPKVYGKTRLNGPLYPFGYGLSYTSFEFKNLKINPSQSFNQGDISIYVDVTNTGKLKGDEVVQLYISDEQSSLTTYDSVLRGFERVSLSPNETKTVEFKLKPNDLAIYDKDMNFVVEPGMFKVKIGNSSQDIKLTKELEIKNN
ncbi:glycoside hydrolase family 3 C-terminal domain-containing protein [Pedobacter sp. SD-b]|uniref:Glycoside hydrolase family 3 C-terminal domain-containing protein n=1 Tax=Pedobacter segetis TaxID=2793069 RepID=A0ABS1BLZ6_9SPHI|nr:glycoside hydrolase family 3 N-terminal domain-containing protein [Pedobacter segetis]MBK0383917.1 glycoside hydrolase family 3 C-terminal domain-containing protein [Pedobacter segetis]